MSSSFAPSTSAIPGVDVQVDVGGREAKLFDAVTSGQTYLYSAQGKLLFSGGITARRAHYGDTMGSTTITALVDGTVSGRDDRPTTNVYGCGINDPTPPASQAMTT